MADPTFEAMMHGEYYKKAAKKPPKDRFTETIEQDIDRYLDTQTFENSPLLSPELKRSKMKSEMLEAIEHSELSKQIDSAITILLNEGPQVLDKETYDAMVENLTSAANALNALDFKQEITENFQKILGINDLTMQACVTLAQEKFKKESYPEALALCMFLCSLAPKNSTYWYRAGIAAQNAQKNDFAVDAYMAAVDLDPTLYQAWIFAANSYLSQGLYKEAGNALEKTKEITKEITIEESWQKLLSNIEEELKAPHK
jgi:tetratricopeptide (TPR) repeat protein